jgi:hypothetical protein
MNTLDRFRLVVEGRSGGVTSSMEKYRKALDEVVLHWAEIAYDRVAAAKADPPDWDGLVQDVRRLLGDAAAGKMDPKGGKWLSELVIQILRVGRAADEDYMEYRKVYKRLLAFEDSLSETVSWDDAVKQAKVTASEIAGETAKHLGQAEKLVKAAIGRVKAWAGASVAIEAGEPGDSFEKPVSTFDVKVGSRSGFTLFLDEARVSVDDVLDAGDDDFFDSHGEAADYFALVKELEHPGSSSKGKTLVLYTARPAKDRKQFEGSRELPVGIFLTSSLNDAEGIGSDFGGRDIWKVWIDEPYLMQMLNAGGVRHYQVVGREPAPMKREMELVGGV